MRSLPRGVRATIRTRRSSALSTRLTKPFATSRSTAILIEPGVRSTIGPILLTARALCAAGVPARRSPRGQVRYLHISGCVPCQGAHRLHHDQPDVICPALYRSISEEVSVAFSRIVMAVDMVAEAISRSVCGGSGSDFACVMKTTSSDTTRHEQRRAVRVILSLCSQCGASHQEHGKNTAGENIKGKTEAGPPQRDTGILNEQVMKEVENTVSSEGSRNQPKVLFKAHDSKRKKNGCCNRLQC